MSRECRVYQRQLRLLGYGLPLYEPNPGTLYDHVRFGDVGITTPNGGFLRLFNCLPQVNPNINRRYGVPDGFEPLPYECLVSTTETDIAAGSWIQSEHTKYIEGEVDFSLYVIPSFSYHQMY